MSKNASVRRAPRMADVAAMAGVSGMTVSRVLRDPTCVTPETLQRIEQAIEATGYVANRVAGSLASRRTNIVGLIVPSLRNSLFVETIQGVSDVLGTSHPLMIADSGYSLAGEEAAIRAFLGQRVCAVVLHNTTHTDRSRVMLREAGIPCVETGNLTRQPIDMVASFSNRKAARAMTAYLIARGHRRIGFASLPTDDNDRAEERRAGYQAALSRARMPVDPALTIEVAAGLAGGAEALTYFLSLTPAVDAVFLSGDVLATGAVLEAKRRRIAIPKRLAIVGTDDSDLQERISPAVTTLRFPRYDIGRRAASMLLTRLDGRPVDPASVDLGFEIVERATA
ncbi:LacI family DNA-binding transcriptional regulator [Acidisoma cellulosilytica]|uniref:LacI family DNA-binding transcriptional regulator n=1 Tax=Acidisoma cellulosilyticum TaxID=2802395 RepID=A0A964E4Y1_9PROT|nr:LacI family DNA-binding transcriptional regulator [Acidisoma cellulosilyticum]MCB8881418.1 LacI family DNA-binding transcriptional regulator [Acidisoma cellulosilyticum]